MLAAPRLVLGQPAILEPSVESGATDSGAGGRFVDGQPILRHQTSLGLRLSTRCSTYRIRSTATHKKMMNTAPIPAPAAHASCESWSRSEEHTSELQSREKLVCRLLLEKKKGMVRRAAAQLAERARH